MQNNIKQGSINIHAIDQEFDTGDIVIKKKNIPIRRQDAPSCYDLTTVCYVFKPEYIMKQKNLFSGKTGFVVIPKHRAIDIDDKIDYKIANFLSH